MRSRQRPHLKTLRHCAVTRLRRICADLHFDLVSAHLRQSSRFLGVRVRLLTCIHVDCLLSVLLAQRVPKVDLISCCGRAQLYHALSCGILAAGRQAIDHVRHVSGRCIGWYSCGHLSLHALEIRLTTYPRTCACAQEYSDVLNSQPSRMRSHTHTHIQYIFCSRRSPATRSPVFSSPSCLGEPHGSVLGAGACSSLCEAVQPASKRCPLGREIRKRPSL